MAPKTVVLVVLALVAATSGAGEKRPLVKPDLTLCRDRPEHFRDSILYNILQRPIR
jgi:hypothetical protein